MDYPIESFEMWQQSGKTLGNILGRPVQILMVMWAQQFVDDCQPILVTG